MLLRLIGPSEDFLRDYQAGFRKLRGCRDNIMVLRTLCQRIMQLGKSLAKVYIDYSTAFDTVSHKFLDTTFQQTGASNKLRAMFRAIYNSASAFTTVKGGDNVNVKSDTFDIKRGVLQGDILSPLSSVLHPGARIDLQAPR